MSKATIGILYNQPAAEGHPFFAASKDVLDQVQAIEASLTELARPSVRLPFSGDLTDLLVKIRQHSVVTVFNLCESVNENPKLIGHPAAILEILGIPFSGSPAVALMLTTDKLLSKQLLVANNITTPRFIAYEGKKIWNAASLHYPVIAKPRFEDASIGIDQESVFQDESSLLIGAPKLFARHGSLVIEEFIAGREFNLSVFGYPKPHVLQVAEIDFSKFPSELHRIVGYRAKWDTTAFEYHHSPRKFPDDLPLSLLNDLRGNALRTFSLFQLRDYGRIDFRVDSQNQVYVLEANANPCLSPDAGFTAAVAMEGLSYTAMTAEFIKFLTARDVK